MPVYTNQAASFVATRLLSVLPPTTLEGPMGIPPGPAVPDRSALVKARHPDPSPVHRARPWSTRPGPHRFINAS